MEKIIIIEDDDSINENLQLILSTEGFEVKGFLRGKEGVAAIREDSPDLILCDIMLPDMNGYEIIEEVRNGENALNIPFIFLTAKAEMKDLRKGMDFGADDYLVKPFGYKELVSVIKARLEKYKKTVADGQKGKNKEEKLSGEEYLLIHGMNRIEKTRVENIKCIFAEGPYSKVLLKSNKILLTGRMMKYWEKILPSGSFVRIHKSTIVNLEQVEKIEKQENNSYRLYLFEYDKPLGVSRRYAAMLKKSKVFL